MRVDGTTLLLNACSRPTRSGTAAAPMRQRIIDLGIDVAINAMRWPAGGRVGAPTQCCEPATSRSQASCLVIWRSTRSRNRSPNTPASRWSSPKPRGRRQRGCATARSRFPTIAATTATSPRAAGRPTACAGHRRVLVVGDDLPVSKLPVGGSYRSGTTQYEEEHLDIIAVWIGLHQCGNCSFICPR